MSEEYWAIAPRRAQIRRTSSYDRKRTHTNNTSHPEQISREIVKVREAPHRGRCPLEEPVVEKQHQWHAGYGVSALLGIFLLAQLWSFGQGIVTIPYSEFLSDLTGGKISEVRVSGNYIEGSWKTPPKNGAKEFLTTRVADDLASQLEQNHVKFSGQVKSTFLATLMSWVLPTLFFFGIW